MMWLFARLATLDGRTVFIIAGVVAVVSALSVAYLTGRDDGSQATVERIERQNDRAERAGDEAWNDSDACFNAGRTWNNETGTCE